MTTYHRIPALPPLPAQASATQAAKLPRPAIIGIDDVVVTLADGTRYIACATNASYAERWLPPAPPAAAAAPPIEPATVPARGYGQPPARRRSAVATIANGITVATTNTRRRKA